MNAEIDIHRPGRDRQLVGVVLRAPVSAWAWSATVHVVTGLPIGALTMSVVLLLGSLAFSLAVTVVPALALLGALLACVRVFTRWQRARFATLLGVELPAGDRADAGEGGRFGRLAARLRRPDIRRQIGYHLLAGPLAVAGTFAVVAAWSAGLLLTAAPLWATPSAVVGTTAVGIVVLFGAPWVARSAAAVDTAAARALLGRPAVDRLAERVRLLEVSRAGVVDAAAAERRRIERDLHDGTQQRLTALAMDLGLARATFADAPPQVRTSIAKAHEDAKTTLAELRAFVRGLHPAVLDERGLDAALSGIAARAPVPVTVTVDLPRRPSRTIEAVAYFVVSEALTNVAKHARASRAEVAVEILGDGLMLTVSDDGCGGAVPEGGTGLRGLRQRVAAVDGVLRVDSPAGAGTTITVVLPCGS